MGNRVHRSLLHTVSCYLLPAAIAVALSACRPASMVASNITRTSPSAAPATPGALRTRPPVFPPTSEPAPSAIALANDGECQPLDLVEPHALPGAIILETVDEIIAYGGEGQGKSTLIPIPPYSFAQISNFPRVSPDLEHLALEIEHFDHGGGYVDSTLWLVGADSAVTVPTRWDKSWGNVVGWADNKDVLLSAEEPAQSSMYRIDTTRGTATTLPLDAFPGMLQADVAWYPWGSAIVTFGAGGTTVVYYALRPDGTLGYVLWDASGRVAIWESPPLWGTLPSWNLARSRFAFSASTSETEPHPLRSDVFVGNDRGDVSPVTDFGTWLPETETDITDVAWSPDSASLAYFVGTRATPTDEFAYRLAITDLKTGRTLILCDERTRFIQTPQWSPDSRYVALTLGTVVDLSRSESFSVAREGIPIGWLTSDDR
jgi:hypothetical protein